MWLNTHRITIDIKGVTHIYVYLLLENAVKKLHDEVERYKKLGVEFNNNDSPFYAHGRKNDEDYITIFLETTNFDDEQRFYAPELTAYSNH